MLQQDKQTEIINKIMFKNCMVLTKCIRKTKNMQVDNAKDPDVVIPVFDLLEYSDNYA